MALRRADWARLGVTPAAGLAALAGGRRVRVAGAVVVRQRPGTAKGFVFLSLEDETGIANAIVRPALFERARATLVHEPFLLVDGILQHEDGVTAVRATAVRPLAGRGRRALPRLPLTARSHRGAARVSGGERHLGGLLRGASHRAPKRRPLFGSHVPYPDARRAVRRRERRTGSGATAGGS